MISSPKSLPKVRLAAAAAVVGLAVAAPTAAQAAESFVGVSGGSSLVTFHSDTIPALSKAVAISGLPAGDAVVAMDAQPSGELLALDTAGSLLSIDAAQHRVTRTVAALGVPAPAAQAATVSVAADGATARVIAGGHDRTVDLATGAITRDVASGPFAGDLGADGILRGVDPTTNTVAIDVDHVQPIKPLGLQVAGATAATTASDGSTWILTGLQRRNGAAPDQSQLLRYEPQADRLRGTSFLFTTLDALAATGPVADDTTAPTPTITIPRQSVRQALANHGFVAVIDTNEGGQTVASARVGKAYRGFGVMTAERAGKHRILIYAKQSAIRSSAGHRVRLHFAVHDYAGNAKVVDRDIRLTR